MQAAELPFTPHHMNARPEDLAGNGGLGRYVLLPGSDGRAASMAERFEGLVVREHPRRHHLYLGSIPGPKGPIEVASIATGMGCPSLDIVVNELLALGARRFIRVGTAGSLQADRVRAGSIVVATASVRDEHTSRVYVPVEVPATASLPMIMAAQRACEALGLAERVHFGTVHCKDSLFAREFGEGPMAAENRAYMELLVQAGTLASEMESSQLFVLAALATQRALKAGKGPILAGAILGVVGDDSPFADAEAEKRGVEGAVDLAFETIRQLAAQEL